MYVGFYPLKDGVIQDLHSGEGLKIMAMGDVNNDKHIDLVTVNNQQDHFTVHFYQGETMQYNSSLPIQVDKTSNNVQIASIVISRDKR